MIILGNEKTHKDNIHIEIIEIKEDALIFKAVSPRNQGLPFGSRFLAEDLSRLSGGHYEIVVLGEGTLGERILVRVGIPEE